MILVCFYGAESTGKTEMAKRMAAHYNTTYVPEVAREMITSNEFTIDDIIKIGQTQTERIIEKCKTANRILFCDTDLITTQIYSQHYLGQVPGTLKELELQIKFDQHFLFDVDVPWVADGLRDLGDRRIQMAKIFKSALDQRKISYLTVRGPWEVRFETVKTEIDRLLGPR
jgi:HTH-type transcriptional repressor of NAD biosynthesis genes